MNYFSPYVGNFMQSIDQSQLRLEVKTNNRPLANELNARRSAFEMLHEGGIATFFFAQLPDVGDYRGLKGFLGTYHGFPLESLKNPFHEFHFNHKEKPGYQIVPDFSIHMGSDRFYCVARDGKLDCVFVAIYPTDKIPDSVYFLPIADKQIKLKEQIYFVGNFEGKLEPCSGHVKAIEGTEIYHSGQTNPGSSGGGITNADGYVVGIHKAGGAIVGGKPVNVATGIHFFLESIRAALIVWSLKTSRPLDNISYSIPCGDHLTITLKLTPEELALGTTKKCVVTRQEICPDCRTENWKVGSCANCKGSGIVKVQKELGPGFISVSNQRCQNCSGGGIVSPNVDVFCPHCKGSGVVEVRQQLGPGFISLSKKWCQNCEGMGVLASSTRCTKCAGKMVCPEKYYFTVSIPPNSRNGGKQTFKGEGNQMLGRVAGDLSVVYNYEEVAQCIIM